MLTIDVTDSHISEGIKYCPNHCPVYLALADAFKETEWEIISTGTRSFTYSHKKLDGLFRYEMPNDAFQWILDFDANVKVKPFSFEIDNNKLYRPAPNWWQKLIHLFKKILGL